MKKKTKLAIQDLNTDKQKTKQKDEMPVNKSGAFCSFFL